MDFGTWIFVVVRFVHVVSAVLWVGFAIFLTFIARPAMIAAGPESGKLQSWLFKNGRLGMLMAATSGITLLAGMYLFLADSDLFRNRTWLSSAPGIIFSLGALLGLIGGAMWGRQTARSLRELAEIGHDVAKGGASPSAESVAKFQARQQQVYRNIQLTTYVVLLALVCMAFAGSLPSPG